MNSYSSKPQSKLDRTMTNEQFEQIVDAILAGKYSWACVLILRFAGYNPLHYIPYRTYNRLIKEHNHQTRGNKTTLSPAQSNTTKIKDLNYQELVQPQELQLKGGKGWFFPW
ncbi:heterocyst differentiation protein [Stanieria cyanosphaera PCC 7437]|uniref:Heterocyst differentiation protein n=1 Tax=Stanieria cyanosphaera (strain ATCC 29371 / PCC 7437) TaxID=111780 RepID=K9XQR8_STAC7|nr:HetP family heterocyst commitment protein [Stanieria cyanosphaera]AFZ34960.1 heterocyst differentiation protein [Stanieria cyanosphaera PCC 7437]